MDIEIHLENKYHPWKRIEDGDQSCWVKGEVFFNGELLRGSALTSLISSLPVSANQNNSVIKATLDRLNGSFAFVSMGPKGLLCVVDRLRSIPIFYGVQDDRLIVADDAKYLRARLDAPFDEKNGVEFLLMGYVTGPGTLFEGIRQVQSGEFLFLSQPGDQPVTFFYHRYWHGDYYPDPEGELLNRLDACINQVFSRLAASIRENDYHAVVPLSGGLDSRLIVAMLKRFGVENVTCFSYGRRGDRESRISKRVAEALDYDWYFVRYSKDTCPSIHSDQISAYSLYAGNFVSTPHLQDFYAVKELLQDGTIPNNALFIPGHSGDMLAGSHIPEDYDRSTQSNATFVRHVIKKHCRLPDCDKGTHLYNLMEGKLDHVVDHAHIRDNESWLNAVEYFDFTQRQAKLIVNSVRVYEFFGFPWRIPLWDCDLIDFFLRLPVEHRIHQSLYRRYASDMVFTGPLHRLGEIDCTTPLSNSSRITELTNSGLDKLRAKINYFNGNSFDVGSAIIWTITHQNPGIVRMKYKYFHNRLTPAFSSELMNEILNQSCTSESILSTNLLGTNSYLSTITP